MSLITTRVRFALQYVKMRTENNIIKLNDDHLECVNNMIFLSNAINSKLQWGAHILCLTKKLNSVAFAVRKIPDLTDTQTAGLVYFSKFHSYISYGILRFR